MIRRLAFLFSCCLLACAVFSQSGQYQFSHLDISQGLSHNQVNCILKDSKGFMWFGTMSGLNRYDGYNFKVFRHKISDSTSLADDYISNIFEGPEGKLWIDTRNGQDIYDPVTEKFNVNSNEYLRQLSLPQQPVINLVKDKRGSFWFLQQGDNLSQYIPASRKVNRLTYKPGQHTGLVANNVSDLASDNLGNLWIIYHNGLLERMNAGSFEVTFVNDSLSRKNPKASSNYKLFIDAQNDVWIFVAGEQAGVYYFNPARNSFLHFDKEASRGRLNSNLITAIQQDNNGTIWVSTDHGGINLLNKKTFTAQYLLNDADDDKSLSQNSITSIYHDNTGIIWAGTYKKGINYYHENTVKFSLYRHLASNPASLPYDDVNRFIEDDKGNLWIGTNGGGLIYFDRTAGKFHQYRHDPANNNSLSNDVIVSMCIDHEKKLWIGTYFGGLDCYDGKSFVHFKNDPTVPGSISDNRIYEIFEDSRQQLWIGTLSGGLNRFDREKKIFYHYRFGDNSLTSDYISALIEDHDQNLWIGTAYGLNKLDLKTGIFTHFLHSASDTQSLSNDNIFSILEDKHGLMWIGTREGLNLFDKTTGKFRNFRMENGMPSNSVLTILGDNNGNIWMSTPNGITKATVTIGQRNIVTDIQFKNFDERDGLQGREFNENAALRTSRGELVFGGANGFNFINPGSINMNPFIPQVVLTDFQVFDKSIAAGETVDKRVILDKSITEEQEITLKYYENVFSIEFAALSFLNAEKNKYAYKLESFNKEWLTTDGKQRKATYTNLDPGDYVFRVKASNDDGLWNNEGVSLRIRVLPPFWKTPTAFVLYALFLVAVLFIARRLTIQRARMRFRLEQQKKEADRMHELDMLKLKFFTNVSHEFRTPLSLIIAPVEKMIRQSEEEGPKKQLQLIHRNAKRLLGLVNQLLDFRKLEMQELRLYPSNGDIVSFIKELSLSFTDIAEKKNINFSFHTSVDALVVSFDPDKMERIMFNLLSNAFKFTHEQGTVGVAVAEKEKQDYRGQTTQFVEIQVKDSGIGIPREKQEKIFERFFQHEVPGSMLNQGSGIGLAISKEFVRLHNGTLTVESEPDKGTCFTVTLPVEQQVPEPGAFHTLPEEMVINAAHEEELEQANANGSVPEKKASVLLVDDNDDIRFYLKDNLRPTYFIYEAANGKEGWQKAQQFQPDLIVSDVMMPEMDGMELCRKIKKDPRTSHIPVILLTARTAEEQKMEGFDTGASDYITKPFSVEILQSRIRNLLLQQEKMRKLFHKQIVVNPSEISVSSVDEQFLRQALEIIEKNISNTEFSVEELSRALFMSRVALYKKLLSLTGKPPLDFIRSIRLKRAAQLLEKSQLNISEIAYEVGFNNPKYFARFFRKEFGILPSEYGNSKRNKN